MSTPDIQLNTDETELVEVTTTPETIEEPTEPTEAAG